MIEIQFRSIKDLTAVLAGIFVALENVVARELYFLLRQPIEKEQDDHSRDANFPRDGRNDFVLRRGCGKITPAGEIMS